MKTAYLDIETSYVGPFTDQRLFKDYKNHQITVIGIRVVEGGADAFVQLAGAEATREKLMAALEGAGRLVTYNGRSRPDKVKGYTGFDFPVIAAQLGVTLDELFPHDDLCPRCWKANLWGGLKAVEEKLGLKRQLPGRDGKWADETWKQFQKTGERRLLDEILAYNREDVFMLARLEEKLAQRGA
jgi:uncharacterized protein